MFLASSSGRLPQLPKADTARPEATRTRPPPAAGDVNREGTVPIGSEVSRLPVDGSRARRSPEPVATVHTPPVVTMGGPGTAAPAVHLTLMRSPVTTTAATPEEQGMNSVAPSWLTAPREGPSQTLAVESWPPIPPRWLASSRKPVPDLPTWKTREVPASTGLVEARSVSVEFNAAQFEGAKESSS